MSEKIHANQTARYRSGRTQSLSLPLEKVEATRYIGSQTYLPWR